MNRRDTSPVRPVVCEVGGLTPFSYSIVSTAVDLSVYAGKPVRVEVFNIQGMLLYQVSFDEAPQIETVELSAYPEGLYLLRFKSEGAPDVAKRIVLSGR